MTAIRSETLATSSEPVVDVRELRKAFGDHQAVAGLSLHIARGECFGLLGPNGAGKSTTLKLLLGLLPPDSGVVHVLGMPVPQRAREARLRIGVVPQTDALDPDFTVAENLFVYGRYFGMSSAQCRARIDYLLDWSGLRAKRDAKIAELSGGMKRRLTLARALINDPEVLFLDEPTTGLDPRTRLDLWQIIRDLVKDGASILLTTQYLEEADELADSITVIDHGKVIAEGTSDQLKSRMGGDVIEFQLSDVASRQKAMEVVAHIGTKKPVFDEETLAISIPVKDGAKVLAEVVRALDKAHIEPASLSLHRPSLDDVFLALTGKKIEVTPSGKTSGKGKR